jgi:hypothetical protein
MKTRQRIIILSVVALIMLACILLLNSLKVEFTGVRPATSSAVWRLDGYKTIPVDRGISLMVLWARVDNLVGRIEGVGGHIVFEEARSNGDEVYLLFRPSNVSDCVILYRGRRKDGKLLSKVVLGFDA